MPSKAVMEYGVDNQHQGTLVLGGTKIPELYKANGGGRHSTLPFRYRWFPSQEVLFLLVSSPA